MAIWVIRRQKGESILTYTSPQTGVRPCGSIAVDGEDALLGWVGEQAQCGDIIVTPTRGTFVKQASPPAGVLA
jgi:hypothetical protein